MSKAGLTDTATENDITLPVGLSTTEATRRRADFGLNAIAEKTPPRWRTFLAKLSSPIAWMLEAAMGLQLVLGAWTEAAMLGTLLLFNAILGFIQEGRAGAALAALKSRLAPTALVKRDGSWIRLPASEVVPGDIIRLALGALIPADATVLSGSLLVDQSTLTGESIPAEPGPGDQIYSGSLVRRGQAVAEVTATGPHTAFGKTIELVRIARSRSTEQAAIFGVTRTLMIVNGTVAVLILIYAYISTLPSPDLVSLAITALLASIPAALPATFSLSAALGARTLAERGVLLTRLSASHEAAAMDVLCADKTGTLTQNRIEVVATRAMPGFDEPGVLRLALRACSEPDQDPIDDAIRHAAARNGSRQPDGDLVRFIPFDPSSRVAEAVVRDNDGSERRIVKGAFLEVAAMAKVPRDAQPQMDDLAAAGHRVLAVAAGPADALQLVGLIALGDPPREESAALIAELEHLGVRTLMVTGDSALTAEAIARKVGIVGPICPPEQLSNADSADHFSVFARVVPEQKYALVRALQGKGHVVGMCGDGTNDAPALRQAQIGIAVSSATDVAKAAASVVLTEPGLAGVVFAVREGRIAFGRLVTYSLNMLVKKFEIVMFLAAGLAMTGHAILTPVLMVLMLITNDFLAMSLTTDRASPSPLPSRWQMRNITISGLVLGACKLAFSIAMLTLGMVWFKLNVATLQTLAFVTLIIGSQAVMYVVRERRQLWSSRPSTWVFAMSALDIVIVSGLALSGTLMAPLPWHVLAVVLAAAAVFALALDQVKRQVLAALDIT